MSPYRCLRCSRIEGLTRSHVPARFALRYIYGSLRQAYFAGKVQLHWLCEDCRREHFLLEHKLILSRMHQLANELEELHTKFVTS